MDGNTVVSMEVKIDGKSNNLTLTSSMPAVFFTDGKQRRLMH